MTERVYKFDLASGMRRILDDLSLYGQTVDTGHWQGVSTQGHPEMMTREILNAMVSAPIPPTVDALIEATECNMPWAEEEFMERVGGEPHNPHRSMQHWPWWRGQIDDTMSHTYSERFWPSVYEGDEGTNYFHTGIRYRFGDLQDVINLLQDHPYTRQATFPIFFPEDTGAVHGGRVPCTLHYHFLRRQDKLHLWYAIRSCDAVRHFRDDVYMAGRLCQWVLNQLEWHDVSPGLLYFTAYSFHVHRADEHLLG
jgi:thymidylate synthase